MIEEDASNISGDKLPMEADDSDFFLKFEESLEKRESGCFDLLRNVTASHTVVQLSLKRSGRQSVTRSSPVNWTVFYEKYRMFGCSMHTYVIACTYVTCVYSLHNPAHLIFSATAYTHVHSC